MTLLSYADWYRNFDRNIIFGFPLSFIITEKDIDGLESNVIILFVYFMLKAPVIYNISLS